MHALALLAAAAAWSAPQTVSAPHTFASPLLVSADSAGGALAAWGWQDEVGQSATSGAAQVRVAGGTVSAEQPAPDGLVAAVAYGDGRSLELASKELDARGRRSRLTVTDGGTTRTLATAFILFRPQLSVAPDGSAVVAWVENRGRRHVVRASMRSGSGVFSKPVTLVPDGQTTLVTTAISKRRDALVAYVRNRQVLVRVRRPGGSWRAPDRMASARRKTNWQLCAAFDDSARAIFVWRRHTFASSGRPGVLALAAAALGPAAARWSTAQSIESSDARNPSLSSAVGGGLVLSYIDGPNSHATARVRVSDASGRLGAAQDAAPPQGGLRSVSAVSDDTAGLVVGWVIPNRSGDGGGIGYAAVEAPGASTFAAREQVTPNEATFDMDLVREATGIRAFWTARPEGTGPPIPVSQIHTLVRTAVRSQ
jgi:hypothetical protein